MNITKSNTNSIMSIHQTGTMPALLAIQAGIDKLRKSLLEVPFLHCVFTLPHEFNNLCRQNQMVMYSLIMKAAWKNIKQIGAEQEFNPGMTRVLHTFESDINYHIRVHSLVTYGGLTKAGEWKYQLKLFKQFMSIYCLESSLLTLNS